MEQFGRMLGWISAYLAQWLEIKFGNQTTQLYSDFWAILKKIMVPPLWKTKIKNTYIMPLYYEPGIASKIFPSINI